MVKEILPAVALLLLVTVAAGTPEAAYTFRGGPMSRESEWVGSARSAGMGHLVATLDDGGAAVWNNPGALAFESRWFARGTDYEWDVVGFGPTDYWSRSFTAGGHMAVGDLPLSLGFGWQRFDLGDLEYLVSREGRITPLRVHAYDDLFNLAAAAEVAGDLGAGFAIEYTRSHLVPPPTDEESGDGTGSAFSLTAGVTYRPEFRSDGRGAVDGSGAAPVLWLRPVAAVALLHGGEKLKYYDTDDGTDLPRRVHFGAGIRAGIDGPGGADAPFPARLFALDVFLGYERERYLIGDEETITHFGFEARMARVFSVRLGSVDERDRGDRYDTFGWGVGLEDISPVGFRFDYGEFPLGRSQPDTERWELNLFYNPRSATFRSDGGKS